MNSLFFESSRTSGAVELIREIVLFRDSGCMNWVCSLSSDAQLILKLLGQIGDNPFLDCTGLVLDFSFLELTSTLKDSLWTPYLDFPIFECFSLVEGYFFSIVVVLVFQRL